MWFIINTFESVVKEMFSCKLVEDNHKITTQHSSLVSHHAFIFKSLVTFYKDAHSVHLFHTDLQRKYIIEIDYRIYRYINNIKSIDIKIHHRQRKKIWE